MFYCYQIVCLIIWMHTNNTVALWNVQKLITKHQWLVHMGSVILDTYKTVETEMKYNF